jgi:two-component system response regulator WspF
MLKIAIVNDTAIAIEALRRAVQSSPDYQILWVAHDGQEAIALCEQERPDLILMDIHMPKVNGVEATKVIMQRFPCQILIVTATITMNASQVFEAMGHGALDVVKTPIMAAPDGYESLLHKIKILEKLHVPHPPHSSNGSLKTGDRPTEVTASTPNSIFKTLPSNHPLPNLVVIGASTGGPNALQNILSQLPQNLNAAVMVVQHIDQQFAAGLAEWLDRSCALSVELARTGDVPTLGKVLCAGTNDHLILRPNLTLRYTHEPATEPNRPSVNVFFQSVADHWPHQGIAVLLTGMGRDGAIGMKSLRQSKWHTIAQDQASCVVYGMPKAAVEMEAAVNVLSPGAIAQELIQRVGRI